MFFTLKQEKKYQREFKKKQKKQQIAILNNIEKFRQNIFNQCKWFVQYFTQQQIIDASFQYRFHNKINDLIYCHICKIYIDDWTKSDDLYEIYSRFVFEYE